MNVEQANALSLPEIFEKIGHKPAKQKGNEYWYLSPFRQEKTPSFHLHVAKNVWYDFGAMKGGKVLHFVCALLESQNEDHTIFDALRWIKSFQGSAMIELAPVQKCKNEGSALVFRRAAGLQHPSFIRYLESRGISAALAKRYLKEVWVKNSNTGKDFYALGLRNENDGYELRNKFFKGCVGAKTISFIRGAKLLPEEIHVFEGLMDFLTALQYQKAGRFQGDAIVLNSVCCIKDALPYIKNYSYRTVCAWLDNDQAGKAAMQTLQDFTASQNLTLKTMNAIYEPHKDVNEWHMHKRGLMMK